MTTMREQRADLVADNLLGEDLADLVNKAVERHGKLPAFSCVLPSGTFATISFEEMGRYSDAVAAFLREELGLEAGDVVAVQAPNTLAYPVLAFGILKAGLTITNINPLYTSDETNHQIRDSGAKVLFAIDLFGDRLAASVEGSDIREVYTLSLVDLFPVPKRLALGLALKHVKKLVPKPTLKPSGTFSDILKRGLRLLAAGADITSYRQNIDAHQPAFYQYTGGTTGRSKGAILSHYNLLANITQGYLHNGGVIRPGVDVLALILPMYHVYALAVGAMSSMYHGAHVILAPAPRPVSNLKVLFNSFDVTMMPGVNTLFIALMQEKWFRQNPPKSMRYCYSGAAPLQPETARAWEELIGRPIYEGYGLTEGTCAVSGMPVDRPPKPGSCGRAMPGTELRIVGEDGKEVPPGEPGELWVRGPQIMKGYLGRPDATEQTITKDGWLRTGDVATLDTEGYLSIVDRIKDMVIVSGFNVYPTDIEDVLTRHEHVIDAAVVGVPDASTGERLIAYVVGRDGLDAETLMAHCRESLTAYKTPKVFELVDELPKSPVGKVLRRELRAMAVQDHA